MHDNKRIGKDTTTLDMWKYRAEAAEAECKRLRINIRDVLERAWKEGCTASGCDVHVARGINWHSMRCPVGVALALEVALAPEGT